MALPGAVGERKVLVPSGNEKTYWCGGRARAPWPSMEWPLQGHFLRHHESLKPRALGESSAPAKRLPQMWLILRMWEPPRTPTSDPSSSRQNIPSIGVSTQDRACRSFLGHLAGGTVRFRTDVAFPLPPRSPAALLPLSREGKRVLHTCLRSVRCKHTHSHTHTYTHSQAQQWCGRRGTPEQSKARARKSYGYTGLHFSVKRTSLPHSHPGTGIGTLHSQL